METAMSETKTGPRPNTAESVTRPRPQKIGPETGLETKTSLKNYTTTAL